MKRLLPLICGLLLMTAGVASAAPWLITYQLSGTLSGDYNGTPFTDSAFSFRLTADPADVVPVTTFDPLSPDDLYVVGAHPYQTGPTVNGTLSITGVGIFTFINNLYASDSQWNNPIQPGIFEFGTDFEGTALDVLDPFFETYKMVWKVNPLPVALYQVGAVPFAVMEAGGAAGDLLLTGASSLTFQTEVPEPSTFALIGAGLAGLLFMRRRRT